eukprot:jgi/Botrbrau1/2744/Bobra.0164s0024.1
MDSAHFLSHVQRQRVVPYTLVLEHVSPATRLLEKRRQMFEVQEALEQQKQEFARKEDLFKRREESLRHKDVELQESLIKFSKFLQENDSKRTRALKKAADEHKICLEKEQEHEQLLTTIETLKQEKERVSAALEMNIKYVAAYHDASIPHPGAVQNQNCQGCLTLMICPETFSAVAAAIPFLSHTACVLWE